MKSTLGTVPKACRNCRIRKIRCDRRTPCSNCITTNISCPGSSSALTGSSAAPRPRSSDERPSGHDGSYDRILERLTALEHAVATKSNSRDDSRTITPIESPCRSDITVATLEGASSFGRQAIYATNLLEHDSLAACRSHEIFDGLNALRSLVKVSQPQDNSILPNQRSNQVINQSEVPPAEFSIKVLQAVKDETVFFAAVHRIPEYAEFEELSRKIYFPIEQISSVELSLFYAMLCAALRGLQHRPLPGVPASDFVMYHAICKEKLRASTQSYEVNIIPSYEHTLILCIAAAQAQTQGDLALQWKLSTIAARQCLALGYHRQEVVAALPLPKSLRVRRLFWNVYFLDRSLVLTLGRAPSIPEYDIDIEPAPISEDPSKRPWDECHELFIDLSRIQAHIYETLYSPAACRISPADRKTTVDQFSQQLSRWHVRWTALDKSVAYNTAAFDAMFVPVDVVYYTTLTILYRAVNRSKTANSVSPECYDAARKGLEIGINVFSNHARADPSLIAFYAVWIHVYCSFTPFVITFLHCVAYSDADDLQLLARSLSILKECSGLVESCQRARDVCTSLYRIAETYVSSNMPSAQHVDAMDHTRTPSVSREVPSGAGISIPPDNEFQAFLHSLQPSQDTDMDFDQMALALDSNVGNFFLGARFEKENWE